MIFTGRVSTNPALVYLANLAESLFTYRAGVGTLYANISAAKNAFPRVILARPALILV